MTTTDSLTGRLAALGFTETEALLYCELVRSGPASGYRLAKAVGKARANVYQALSQLAQRGAVLIDDSEVHTFRATDPTELMRTLAESFRNHADAAQAQLQALTAPVADDRIYHLRAIDQVFERATAMIDRTVSTVLVDAFPEPLERILPALERAAARGVTVAALVYDDRATASFPLVSSAAAHFALARWPGLQLSVVTDAREHLVSLLDRRIGQVLHGIWSDSAYLSCLQHSGLAAEIRLASLAASGISLDEIALLQAQPSGLQKVILAADARPALVEDAA
jgi:sugar-specific transcriptional regulator TrmB